jgi:hypothetical protein
VARLPTHRFNSSPVSFASIAKSLSARVNTSSAPPAPVISVAALPAALSIGAFLGALGDSHNYGYGVGTCLTPFHAFCRIAQTRGLAGPTNPYTNIRTANIYQDGASGRSLAGTRTAYNAWSGRTTRTFLAVQESGSQGTGQTTATAYGDTWDLFYDDFYANTPNAIWLNETSFNFHRGVGEEFAEAGREWGPYNTVLRARIAARNRPDHIVICETDRDIKLLESQIGQSAVWIQPEEANPFHFRSPGNLMIALGYFKALRIHDVTLAHLADIGTNIVSSAHQQVCLDIYNAN